MGIKRKQMKTLQSAKLEWEVEVEHEKIRLIEAGWPPWKAAGEAVKNVLKRRARGGE